MDGRRRGRRAHREYPLGAPGALPESCIVSHEARGADGEEGTHSTDDHPRAGRRQAQLSGLQCPPTPVGTPVPPCKEGAAGYPRLFDSLVVCTQELSRVKTDLDVSFVWEYGTHLGPSFFSTVYCPCGAQKLGSKRNKKRYRGGWAWRRWLDRCEKKWDSFLLLWVGFWEEVVGAPHRPTLALCWALAECAESSTDAPQAPMLEDLMVNSGFRRGRWRSCSSLQQTS